MTKQQRHIREHVVPVLQPYVRKIALYGSQARGTARADSDVDLLVVLRSPEERPTLGLHWFTLEQELTEQLHHPVEIVTEDALDPYLRPFIKKDCVVLYEE